MQKGFVQILIIITALLALAGGVYVYKGTQKLPPTQTPSPYNNYDNYKTYSHKTLGFQFEYGGKDLTAKEDTEEESDKRGNGNFRKNFKGYIRYEPGEFLGAVVVLDKDGNFDTNPLTIWVFDNPDGLDIDSWYKKYWYYPFVWGDFTHKGKVELAPKDEATISGQMGKSGVVDYKEDKPKFVYVSKDQKMYLFRIIGESGDKILPSFKFSNQQTADCKVTGCSGQICSDKEVITTCDWQEAYACYRIAKCERQTDGECGWTQTEELTKCLQEKVKSQ